MMSMSIKLDHVLESQQFTRDWLIDELFPLAKQMEYVASSGGNDVLHRKRMFYLFYEPSTRTRVSFESAMLLLGGITNGTENAREFSSVTKGETLEDTIRMLNGYLYDVIVIRYHEEGGAARAAAVSQVPIINAGDGSGQHPTQALLDVYTIRKELGDLRGITVAMVGDLTYGRTVHSLTYLLAKFPDVRLHFVSPEVLRIKQGIRDYLDRRNVPYSESTNLADVIHECDVVYMTRAQTERFSQAERFDHRPGSYQLTSETIAKLPAHGIVMHPLPRREELPIELDNDPRVAVFRQAQNGLFVRMALLNMLVAR
jgi:aspartate carbamoyltransferase catalytic subunit